VNTYASDCQGGVAANILGEEIFDVTVQALQRRTARIDNNS
jgi:hypothetical protein